MNLINKSKRVIRGMIKKMALSLLIHHFIGFRVFKALWCRTGDNCLIVLMQKMIMLYRS
jgi:hypothetical protein